MNHAELFRAWVDQALDQRRDPLDDPRVCTWLEQHPEQLDDFARWREVGIQLAAATDSLSDPSRTRDHRRFTLRLRPGAKVAAALLVTTTALLWIRAAMPPAAAPTTAAPTVSAPTAAAWSLDSALSSPRLGPGVLTFESRRVVRTADRLIEVRQDDRGIHRHTEFTLSLGQK